MTEPIWLPVATALATKAATGLYELVVKRFAHHPDRQRALTEAAGAAPDSAEVHALAEAVHATEREDPEFAKQLRTEFQKLEITQQNYSGGRPNVTGDVSGRVVQVSGDVAGSINL